jgi:hypothetical protein
VKIPGLATIPSVCLFSSMFLKLIPYRILQFSTAYLLAKAEQRFNHITSNSQIENNCYSRQVLNKGFLVRFLLL